MWIKWPFILLLLASSGAFAQNRFIESCLAALRRFSPPVIEVNTLNGQRLSLEIGSEIGRSSARIFRSMDGQYSIKLMLLSNITEAKILRRQNLVYHEFYATQYLQERGLGVQRYVAVPVEMNLPTYGRVIISVKEYVPGIEYQSIIRQMHQGYLSQSEYDFYLRHTEDLQRNILPLYRQYFEHRQFMRWLRRRIDPDLFTDLWALHGDVNLRDFIFTGGRWVLLDP